MWVLVVRRWLNERDAGAALVEVALALPLLLILAFGVVGVGRVLQAQMGVSAVVREAARVAASAQDAGEAGQRGLAAGQAVATGYNLTNGSLSLTVVPGGFERGGQVRSTAHYDVSLADLPLMGWAHVGVSSEHVERIDLYRSRWNTGGQP
ncbi:MAG: TadE/TadG family type IV pilus assembly protein [Anaerolineae bacterium]